MITEKVFYYFDPNNRVYEKNGVKSSYPFYEDHFIKITIIDETEKEYISNHGGVINKRSMMYAFNKSTKKKVYTEQEMKDDVYLKNNSYKLSEAVRKLDANLLRKVEDLLVRNKLI